MPSFDFHAAALIKADQISKSSHKVKFIQGNEYVKFHFKSISKNRIFNTSSLKFKSFK